MSGFSTCVRFVIERFVKSAWRRAGRVFGGGSPVSRRRLRRLPPSPPMRRRKRGRWQPWQPGLQVKTGNPHRAHSFPCPHPRRRLWRAAKRAARAARRRPCPTAWARRVEAGPPETADAGLPHQPKGCRPRGADASKSQRSAAHAAADRCARAAVLPSCESFMCVFSSLKRSKGGRCPCSPILSDFPTSAPEKRRVLPRLTQGAYRDTLALAV